MLVLEHMATVGGVAAARQTRSMSAVAYSMAGMQRLGHGAEIGLDARDK